MLNKELLSTYRKQGFIIGPNETEENFLKRIAICTSSFPEEYFPISSPTVFNKDQVRSLLTRNIKYQNQKYASLLAVFSWLPIFLSNYKLPFWIGGAVWICSKTDVVIPILQLREHFVKPRRRTLYLPEEICIHEALHAIRTSFEEPKFEELLAYSTSPNFIHKWFGPLFETSWESTLFLIFLVLGSLGALFFYISTIPFLVYLLFLIVRLYSRHNAMYGCTKNLEKLFPQVEIFSMIIHLTDREILKFSRMSQNEISSYIKSQSCPRWRQISTLFKYDTKENLLNNHKRMIETIIASCFKQIPKFIKRITIGISNEVYEVRLSNRVVIVRLSHYDKFLMGSHDHIPKFRSLGIKVPEILAEDYSKSEVSLSYQIQSKIEGQDLGEIIENLSHNQLKSLAKEIAYIFTKVKTIPSSNKFGVIWGGEDNDTSDTWTERMQIWIEESRERGIKTGIMDPEMESIANNLFERYKSYFSNVIPTTYYGDICSKNIIINNGVFNGLVDLDGLTQGDPLEAIGRIKISWYGTQYGEIYVNAIMYELGLSSGQKELVTMYALLNKISWACENGIQFNQNTKAEINWEKAKRDKKVIKILAEKLMLNDI